MPSLAGELIDGGRLSAGEYRNKIVVVNFWNPYCGPCRTEAEALERTWEKLRSLSVLVVGVHYVGGDWPPSVSAAMTFLHQYGVTYPVLEDPGSKLALAFGIQGIPSTVVTDPAGELRFRILGGVKPGQVEELVARLDR